MRTEMVNMLFVSCPLRPESSVFGISTGVHQLRTYVSVLKGPKGPLLFLPDHCVHKQEVQAQSFVSSSMGMLKRFLVAL